MRFDTRDAADQWACNRKKAYPSAEIADKVARNVNLRDETADLVSYACTRCGRWHVGRRMAGG